MKWGAVAVLTTAVALSGCGADEAEVLQGAFDDKVKSANVEFAFVMGSGAGEVRMGFAGPYQSNGSGSSEQSTGSSPYTARAVGPSPITPHLQCRQGVHRLQGRRVRDPRSDLASFRTGNRRTVLDLAQMRDWFPQTHTSEEASLDGEPVTRITGRFDVAAAGKDLRALGKQDAMLSAATFSGALFEELGKTATDPRFTVDVARADGTLRRVEANLRVKKDGQTATVKLTVRLKDVNQPVTIDVPTSGKPFVELGRRTVEETPVGKLYGDGGPDGKLRVTVAVARGRLDKEVTRWNAAMEKAEASEEYDEAVSESRRLADVIEGTRSAIKDERGESAALKRDRNELLAAMAGFMRALRECADELEALDDDQALEAAAAALERTAIRYDEAFAAFKP